MAHGPELFPCCINSNAQKIQAPETLEKGKSLHTTFNYNQTIRFLSLIGPVQEGHSSLVQALALETAPQESGICLSALTKVKQMGPPAPHGGDTLN